MGEYDRVFDDFFRVTTYASVGVLLTVGAATVSPEESTGGQSALMPTAGQVRPWQELGFHPLLSTQVVQPEHWRSILAKFAHEILGNTVEPDPKFDTYASEHFWELI